MCVGAQSHVLSPPCRGKRISIKWFSTGIPTVCPVPGIESRKNNGWKHDASNVRPIERVPASPAPPSCWIRGKQASSPRVQEPLSAQLLKRRVCCAFETGRSETEKQRKGEARFRYVCQHAVRDASAFPRLGPIGVLEHGCCNPYFASGWKRETRCFVCMQRRKAHVFRADPNLTAHAEGG